MKINIIDGYIVSVQGEPSAGDSRADYSKIISILNNKPDDIEGYEYKLNASTLRWNKVKVDVVEEQLTDDEALEELLNTLNEYGK